jgi:hypothetical protein
LMRRSRWQMRRLRGKKERGIHHRVRRGHGGRAGKKKTTQRRRDAETQSTLSYAENFAEEGAIGSNGSRIGGERSDCLVDGKTAPLKIAKVRHPNAVLRIDGADMGRSVLRPYTFVVRIAAQCYWLTPEASMPPSTARMWPLV